MLFSGQPQGGRGAFDDFAKALLKSVRLAKPVQGVGVLRKGVRDVIPVGIGEMAFGQRHQLVLLRFQVSPGELGIGGNRPHQGVHAARHTSFNITQTATDVTQGLRLVRVLSLQLIDQGIGLVRSLTQQA
ncbi:MAG: hypothetical protein Q8K50_05175, partial [Hydrogenophaga sp.]|nr:hypothetical protein [Hydrogenophaga sp.]